MALAASGAVGHSAAIEPAWAVPAKAVHLLAGAVWAGGIVWLMTLDRSDDEGGGFATRVERVSSVALGAVLAVALSGVVQTRLFLGAWSDLVRSLYGVVVLAKVAGLLALAGFGAYYQRRVIARLADAGVRATFRRLLGREMALMTLVVLLGGLLAYLAPPARPPLPGTASTSSAAAHHPER
jgi:putative copper export protein